ncbi:nickel pincer cofactor biosynthesis protein LarC [Haloquadratum walsbyi]|jgi:conserved hypothetical protein TIGR00299|uniref:Putative nickel insertion protein n=1 Tax=Haloquadratum walsbyi J07HQW2 TaxID=1238425 RepID=U1MY49_9EURY|nr:nickel pincer cofactor biosynthesis protein LarC [Haloquadratum walsbyi]ERG95399.1 MAG: TIGR00299 family protein [Haloquadratum walsbyi J07HQW2]
MSLLVFDGQMGASGDMILAALISAGASPDVLSPIEDALGIRYVIDTETKGGIAATRVRIVVDSETTHTHSENQSIGHKRDQGQAHTHDESWTNEQHTHNTTESDDHTHSYDGDDTKSHNHGHDHDESDEIEGHGPTRSYKEVIEIVEGMGLDADVESTARKIFNQLGTAEAAVHGTSLSSTQFHEVGADDAIADIVGAVLLLTDLDIDQVYVTPVSTGSGEITMSHGSFSVPPPAVVEIAGEATWSLRGGPVEAELLTPTGAAILAHIAEGVRTLPALDVTTTSYGAGGYDFEEYPNVLRAIVGRSPTSTVSDVSIDASSVDESQSVSETDEFTFDRESIVVLETNLDDATPEVLGSLQKTLTDVGALDVTIVPTAMKKSRPGHLIKVIVKPDDASGVAQRLAAETGTLGIREHPARHRWRADRKLQTITLTVDDNEYEITVKIASDGDGIVYDYSAEYDDALAVATTTGRPVREIRRQAEAAARSIVSSDS